MRLFGGASEYSCVDRAASPEKLIQFAASPEKLMSPWLIFAVSKMKCNHAVTCVDLNPKPFPELSISEPFLLVKSDISFGCQRQSTQRLTGDMGLL